MKKLVLTDRFNNEIGNASNRYFMLKGIRKQTKNYIKCVISLYLVLFILKLSKFLLKKCFFFYEIYENNRQNYKLFFLSEYHAL